MAEIFKKEDVVEGNIINGPNLLDMGVNALLQGKSVKFVIQVAGCKKRTMAVIIEIVSQYFDRDVSDESNWVVGGKIFDAILDCKEIWPHLTSDDHVNFVAKYSTQTRTGMIKLAKGKYLAFHELVMSVIKS
jgi:hypothetical protein